MKSIKKPSFETLKTLTVLFIIPLFFTWLFGFVYSKVYIEEINVGILNQDQSTIAREIIQGINDHEGLQINGYYEHAKEMDQDLLSGQISIGVIIPDGLTKEVLKNQSPNVLVMIDESNIVVGNTGMANMSSVLNAISNDLQIKILQDNGLSDYVIDHTTQTLSFVERVLYEPQMNYYKYVLIGFLGIFVQQTYLAIIVPKLIQHKKKMIQVQSTGIKWQTVVMHIAKIGIATIISSALCYIFANVWFGHPIKGNIGLSLLVHCLLIINLTGVSLLIAAVFDDLTYSAQFTLLLSVPTLLVSGIIWPEYLMPELFLRISKVLWPLSYYVNPMKYLHIKGAGIEAISPYLLGGVIFAVIWIPLGAIAYKSKINGLKELEKTSQA